MDRGAKPIVIIVVILLVVFIIIPFVGGIFLVYQMSNNMQVEDTRPPIVTLYVETFTNPTPDATTNGGGWRFQITSVQGGDHQIDSLFIKVAGNQSTLAQMQLATASFAGAIPLYRLQSGDPSHCQGVGGAGQYIPCDDLGLEDMRTVENASVAYLHNGEGTVVTIADYIYVYADHDGDGVADIPPSASLTVTDGERVVAATPLG